MRALPTLLMTLTLALGAADIDFAVVDDPRSAAFTDRGAELRWQQFFDPAPQRVTRLVDHLVRHAPDQADTLLAARLLYRGQPWTRREGDASGLSAREWRRRSQGLLAAILRELRWRDSPDLIEVHRRFLAQVTESDLAVSALVNLLRLDAAAAKATALALADPGLAGALPGSAEPAVRRQATAFLVGSWGLDDPDARQALRNALQRGDAVERNFALGLIPRGAAADLLEPIAIATLARHRAQPYTGADAFSIVLLLERLRGVRDRALATALFDLAVHGERDLAVAAATALAGGAPWDLTLPVETAAGRVNGSADLVLRNALLDLILRLKPGVVREAVGADSPWSRLAAHRERLAAWEWEGMTR